MPVKILRHTEEKKSFILAPVLSSSQDTDTLFLNWYMEWVLALCVPLHRANHYLSFSKSFYVTTTMLLL